MDRRDHLRILSAARAVHVGFADEHHEALCDVADRVALFAPSRMAPLLHSDSPLPALSQRGWELFADVVPDDVTRVVLGLQDDPSPLADALAERRCTLIHGDLWPVNVALLADQVIFLDWGFASWAPAALDIEWYLLGAGAVVDTDRDTILADYQRISGRAYDSVAMRLALLAGIVDLGWNKALDAVENADPSVRRRERADLDWWVTQARASLDAGLIAL